MDKRKQILQELDIDVQQTELNSIFEQLDQYQIQPPSAEATRRLISSLKPVLAQETKPHSEKQRFKDIMTAGEQTFQLPVILQLTGLQTALLQTWFIGLSIAILAGGIMLTSLLGSDVQRFLISAAPVLGLLTFYYEYRAQLYRVEEMEAACRYSAAQVAAARIVVVVGYNMILFSIATLCIGLSYHQVLWQYMISWLAPLLFILGLALFTSLKFGITGGCITAGIAWLVKLTLLNGDSVLNILAPGMSVNASNIISMVCGIGLIAFSVNNWRLQQRS